MEYRLGPWHIESKGCPYVLDSDGKVVVGLPLTLANARLIAAAPTLFAACDAVWANPDDPSLWISQVIDAINQALGE